MSAAPLDTGLGGGHTDVTASHFAELDAHNCRMSGSTGLPPRQLGGSSVSDRRPHAHHLAAADRIFMDETTTLTSPRLG
jgi:hypothetical protein